MNNPIKLSELPLASALDAGATLLVTQPSGALERVDAATMVQQSGVEQGFFNLLSGGNSVQCDSKVYNIATLTLDEEVKPSECYTLTMKYRCGANTQKIRWSHTDGSSTVDTDAFTSKEWAVASFTYAVNTDHPIINKIRFFQMRNGSTGSEIEWVVLRKGNVPVAEWVPSRKELLGGGV